VTSEKIIIDYYNSTSTGVNGTIRIDNNYLYVFTDGIWKRIVLSSFSTII
jgi:hypothetical protein